MGAYDKDFYAWAMEQAALLRAGRLQDVDAAHLAWTRDSTRHDHPASQAAFGGLGFIHGYT